MQKAHLSVSFYLTYSELPAAGAAGNSTMQSKIRQLHSNPIQLIQPKVKRPAIKIKLAVFTGFQFNFLADFNPAHAAWVSLLALQRNDFYTDLVAIYGSGGNPAI